jgi:pyruvate/2-oxoglutarate dehydrogenase complex dihydrolipoamide acyltransferase (E2) component
MRKRAIAQLTALLLATGAVAEPLNYDSCENIQDSREYAHCIATLGAAGGGKKTAAPPAQAEPAAQQPQAAAPEKETPAPRVAARKTRGGRVVLRAAPRGGGRVRAVVSARPQKAVRGGAKPAASRGKGRR